MLESNPSGFDSNGMRASFGSEAQLLQEGIVDQEIDCPLCLYPSMPMR
ncbi:hypothetical protein ES703_67875 [subsurface metagenome]